MSTARIRGVGRAFYIPGDQGDRVYPPPVPAEQPPPVTELACLDDFDRVVAGGWGSGPLGTWLYNALNPYFEESFSVDGDRGIFSLQEADQGAGWVWINGATDSAPLELLVRFAVEVNWNSWNIEWTLQLDGAPDPENSADWIYMFLDFVDVQGTFASHDMSLEFTLQPSDSTYDEALGLFPKTGIANDDYARWDLWVRMRYDTDGTVRVRLWEASTSEPGTWTMEAGGAGLAGKSFPNVGHYLSPDSDGINYTIFETHSLEIVEGCG